MDELINADLNKPAFVRSRDLAWDPSPLPGVDRRKLDRTAAESGRVTTIVRYQPGSKFSEHVHKGGEEFFVLEGTFSDQYGDFPKGTYVRNPVGSRHAPHSDGGCTIFVKLEQMDPEDQTFVRTDTNGLAWSESRVPGVAFKPLHEHGSEQVALVRLSAGASLAEVIHAGGAEYLVLDGCIESEGNAWAAGSWLRLPKNRKHTLKARELTTLFVKVGHLKSVDKRSPSFLRSA